MNEYQKNLLRARDLFGSFAKLGKACGVSGIAVQKWLKNGNPPRTEYTGETSYAEIIAVFSAGKINKDDLLPNIEQTKNKIIDRRSSDRRVSNRRSKLSLTEE